MCLTSVTWRRGGGATNQPTNRLTYHYASPTDRTPIDRIAYRIELLDCRSCLGKACADTQKSTKELN